MCSPRSRMSIARWPAIRPSTSLRATAAMPMCISGGRRILARATTTARRGAADQQGPGVKCQQRSGERRRHRVSLMKRPVKTAWTAVEREGDPRRDAEPEEMQRRLIARAPQPHPRADQENEQPDRGEHEIACAARPNIGSHGHTACPFAGWMMVAVKAFDAAVVFRLEDVICASARARPLTGEQVVAPPDLPRPPAEPKGDVGCRNESTRSFPEPAVFNLTPLGALDDVRDAEADEHHDDGRGEDGAAPRAQTASDELRAGRQVSAKAVTSTSAQYQPRSY